MPAKDSWKKQFIRYGVTNPFITMSKALRGKRGKYFLSHLATEVTLTNTINIPRTMKDLDFILLAS